MTDGKTAPDLNHDVFVQLRALGRSLDALRKAQDEAVAVRDHLLRQGADVARDEGIRMEDFARMAGISRPRLYEVLNDPESLDPIAHEDFRDEFDRRMYSAWLAWEDNGQQGDPADYFDVRTI